MKKRSDKISTTSAVAGFADVIYDVLLLPAGGEFRREKEHLIWNQFTSAPRKISVMLTLAKIVNMEADICAAQVEPDVVGMMFENKCCTQIPNPLTPAVDTS